MKILIVRYAAIGDCIMTAWAATALRSAYPKAEIHWAIQPRCVDVIDSRRLARPQIVPRERARGRPKPLAMLRYWLSLRKEKFDLGFDFQGHSKTALALRFAAPKIRAVLKATDAFARALNPLYQAPESLIHIVERECWLVSRMAGAGLPDRPIMPALDQERAIWKEKGPYVSIQTGAGHQAKMAPPHYWQTVADQLGQAGVPVVAMGGPSDPQIEGAVNLAGQATLSESLACVAESRVHLAADTGTGHAAAAYGVPTVSVFGPTDPSVCRPWGDEVTVLQEGDSTADVSPDRIADAALDYWRLGR